MLKYYSLEVAREQLCCLIARTDLSLCFGASDAFEEYIKTAPTLCILMFLGKQLLEI